MLSLASSSIVIDTKNNSRLRVSLQSQSTIISYSIVTLEVVVARKGQYILIYANLAYLRLYNLIDLSSFLNNSYTFLELLKRELIAQGNLLLFIRVSSRKKLNNLNLVLTKLLEEIIKLIQKLVIASRELFQLVYANLYQYSSIEANYLQ